MCARSSWRKEDNGDQLELEVELIQRAVSQVLKDEEISTGIPRAVRETVLDPWMKRKTTDDGRRGFQHEPKEQESIRHLAVGSVIFS